MVSRAQALVRAATIWQPGTVLYSQSAIHQPDGYRQDCSGYASLCWAIPPGEWGGENTESLVTEGWMSEIPAADLQPGDAIGLCGPGTLGNAGHIQIFESWTATGLVIWEQAGGTWGPTRRTLKRIPLGYLAYRYRGITEMEEEEDMTPEQDAKLTEVWQRMQATDNRVREGVLKGSLVMDDQPGEGPAQPVALNQQLSAVLASLGRIEAALTAGGGPGGPSLDAIRTVVDEELDEQSIGGADRDS